MTSYAVNSARFINELEREATCFSRLTRYLMPVYVAALDMVARLPRLMEWETVLKWHTYGDMRRALEKKLVRLTPTALEQISAVEPAQLRRNLEAVVKLFDRLGLFGPEGIKIYFDPTGEHYDELGSADSIGRHILLGTKIGTMAESGALALALHEYGHIAGNHTVKKAAAQLLCSGAYSACLWNYPLFLPVVSPVQPSNDLSRASGAETI
jgi:hypothetical protein